MTTARVMLTDVESERLRVLSERTGKTEEQLLREAVGALLFDAGEADQLAALRRGRGIWSGRTDLPDFAKLRAELDRL